MPTVYLGNKAAIHPNGDISDEHQITKIHIPDDDPHHERTRNIVHANGIWAAVSDAHPTWIATDDKELETYLSNHFGCPVKDMDTANQERTEAEEAAEEQRRAAHPPEKHRISA